jgi:hypothetical protein
MAYADLLKDPRWQRLRLEVMDRAGFKCELCGNGKLELNIHHKRYRAGAKPWEYELPELLCICLDCHQKLHGITPEAAPAVNIEMGISRYDKSLLIFMLSCPEESSFLEASDFDDPTVYESKGISDKYPVPDVLELKAGDIARVRCVVMRARCKREHKAKVLSELKKRT